MPDVIDTRFLLQTVYLTLKQSGYSEISLKTQDLLEYVPKIEFLLREYGFEDKELFLKTPGLETYDKFKEFLITNLCENKVGYFNDKCDAIIISCHDFYIWRCQEWASNYNDIIRMCCYFVTKDLKFVDGRNCQNCFYGSFVLKNGVDEELYCDLNKYAEYMELVSAGHFCDEHVFFDENYSIDEVDLKRKENYMIKKEEIKKARIKILQK